MDKRVSESHDLDCLECAGSGEVLAEGAHPHDPNARVFVCDQCNGKGQIECSGCDVCGGDACSLLP